MAKLPPDGEWLIQQIAGDVVLFRPGSGMQEGRDYTDPSDLFYGPTEEEIVRFDPADSDAAAKAQHIIYTSNRLTDEQKTFAHFWSGYFYAHAQHLVY